MTRPPAEPGDRLDRIDTPALLLDLDAFDSNLERLDRALEGANVSVRPHAKSHKCPEIARIQVSRGAVGICCQKLSEAEVMAQHGITDILICNQIVTRHKIERLCQLSLDIKVSVLVDDEANIELLDEISREHQCTLDVLVELNVGSNRCGVNSPESALTLAKRITDSTNLRFTGLHAYQGAAQHSRTFNERKSSIDHAALIAKKTQELLQKNSIPCNYITGAGTGTFELEAASNIYTEIQPGSYIFMDADYQKNLNQLGNPINEFKNSLFVLASVISHTTPGRPIVDAGLKSLAVDSGMPRVFEDSATYISASDEHGVLTTKVSESFPIGSKVRLIPGHCDPTVNLYDWIVCVRNDQVTNIWPVSARGASL